jgi:hypothetical protein
MPGRAIRDFFWAAHEGLAVQLQHGASAEQDSTQGAAVVMRKCMVSCAHVACMLVTIYHMLLDGPQQQQQQQGAAGGGAAVAVATAAAAVGGSDAGGQHPTARPMQQLQQQQTLHCLQYPSSIVQVSTWCSTRLRTLKARQQLRLNWDL